MRTADLARLVSLAAIWGASFIFIRIVAPAFGAVLSADLRVLLAGFALLLYAGKVGVDVGWRRHWKQYLFIGTLNTAVPFSLYAFAGLHIPASYSVILNSTAPLFGAIFAALWLGERLTGTKIAGLATGIIGVATVTRGAQTVADPLAGAAILACLGAACCYALAGVYLRKFGRHLQPRALAGACQVTAGLVLSPSLFFFPPPSTLTTTDIGCLLGLSFLCSGVAYLLYYRLIADLGPTKALTVTFLMPAFGMLWARIFLREPVTLRMLVGCSLIILGTSVVAKAR